MNISRLKSNWLSLLPKSKDNQLLGNQVFATLIQAYSAAGRYYHNLNHVQYLLDLSESIKEFSERLSVIQLSAWFHDYIYDSQAQDNEARSAIYAEATLHQLNFAPETIESVKQIILSTQNHQPLLDSIDNLIFLDLDLAILGSESSNYLKYAQAIRKEYCWLSDRDYCQGRIRVLTNFLTRNRIYFTDYFSQKFEQTARENLITEIKLYSGTI